MNKSYITSWLVVSISIGVIMGMVTYVKDNDFWFGVKAGGLCMVGLFLFCSLWLFVITPFICPEIKKL